MRLSDFLGKHFVPKSEAHQFREYLRNLDLEHRDLSESMWVRHWHTFYQPDRRMPERNRNEADQ